MATSTINVSLPDSLTAYVEAQVEYGDYGNPSEYVRDLIVSDRARRIASLESRLTDNSNTPMLTFSDEELSEGNFVDLCRKKL